MTTLKNKAYIAVGSNLISEGNSPLDTVLRVIQKLIFVVASADANSAEVSQFYDTPAFPADSGANFVNAVVAVSSGLSAEEILAKLHEIELNFGRVRDQRWGARVIDLDLLSFQDEVRPTRDVYEVWKDLPLETQKTTTPSELILPHPRLQDRGFVLLPLCDIAPNWRHPYLGKTARELCDALPLAQKKDAKVIKDAKIQAFFDENPRLLPCNP
ncbi:MAG: 2-amino-4-hydroxy-6-hydroxymethyldihydropteridine diphosphokinase [Halocynthiibacter sp.]